MKALGWVVIGAGLLWATVGAENMLNGIVRGWHFHQWELASEAIRYNGTVFELPASPPPSSASSSSWPRTRRSASRVTIA